MKRKLQLLAVPFGIVTLSGTPVFGQSADALIEKLVDKGILTVSEANELREEADQDFKDAYEVKTGLPDWVTSLDIGGDLRARYEMFHADHPDFVDRHRFRYRVRPDIVVTLHDNFELGFRLTSSEEEEGFGGEPLSGNATFTDNGSKKWVFIDIAYAKWTPLKASPWTGVFTVGKMENPLAFSSLIFDRDYTPEGFAQEFAYELSETQTIGVNLGQFVLDEFGGNSSDPWLLGAQVRLDSEWNDRIQTTAGIGGLLITSEERLAETPGGGSAVPNVNTGNTRSNGVLTEDYNPFIADAAFTYTLDDFWQYSAAFPIRFSAEYLKNPAADGDNEGYSLGVRFGKSGKRGLWELSYLWKHLESDAWYEELVDSDFGALTSSAGYCAGTNIEGHIIQGSYSPYDSLTLGLTYFLTERITGVTEAADEAMSRLQVDAVWKF